MALLVAIYRKIFIFRDMPRFVNPHLRNTRRNLWELFLWRIGRYADCKWVQPPPPDFHYPASYAPFEKEAPLALWIGHCTFFIQIGDIALLTDPIWDPYCSPIPIAPLRRRTPPPFSIEELPPIDIVLLSHNHYDHLSAKAVSYLRTFHPQAKWCIPLGMGRWFRRRRLQNLQELDWWQTYETSRYRVTAVPAQHFSGRALWDMNRTLWNGYVLEVGDKRLYFAGDTGYNAVDFKAIGERWRYMDLSLIPIGTYSPQKFMSPVHISPYEAVEIHSEVRSRFSLGMHWKTFCLSDEPFDRPPYDLYLAMKAKNLPFASFLPNEVGLYVNW